VAHEDRSAPLVEVVLGERERRLDAQAGAPQDDDHCSHAQAVTIIGRVPHDPHDLLDRGRIRWLAHALVRGGRPGWYPGIVAPSGAAPPRRALTGRS
jgi:hypothetical protein